MSEAGSRQYGGFNNQNRVWGYIMLSLLYPQNPIEIIKVPTLRVLHGASFIKLMI